MSCTSIALLEGVLAWTSLISESLFPHSCVPVQVMPTSGTRSVSLWDVPDKDTLQVTNHVVRALECCSTHKDTLT